MSADLFVLEQVTKFLFHSHVHTSQETKYRLNQPELKYSCKSGRLAQIDFAATLSNC